MVTLQREGGGVPIARFPDVRVIIERAAKGALLNAPDLRDLALPLGFHWDDVAVLALREIGLL